MVRHGTTPTTGKVLPGRAKGLHLAEHGRAQAEALAQHFRGLAVDAVYASPLERARETAAPMAAILGLPVVTEKGLLECDFGDWTGSELASLRRLPEWKTVQQHPSGFRFPAGESFPELSARIAETMRRLAERHPGGVVVAVSHADCIKAAVAAALGVPLDLFQRIVIDTCSCSAVTYSPDGPVVLAANSAIPPAGLPRRKGAA